jgi:uncharacterized protein (UPF0335 family)
MRCGPRTAARISPNPGVRNLLGTRSVPLRGIAVVISMMLNLLALASTVSTLADGVKARGTVFQNTQGGRPCSLRAVNHLSVWLPGLTHWLFLCGHFRASIYQGGTMSDVTIPGGKIRAFVERVENIDTELQELNEQKKEVFAEAKGEGFDVKILKEIIKLRKQDEEERDERESLLDLYMRAMEQAGPEKVAKAA